jgi:hypothetical protein
MEQVFLPLAGLTRGSDVAFAHTLRCEPPAKLGAAVRREAEQWCQRVHGAVPEHIKAVVAHGEESWDMMQQRPDLSIQDWRGHLGPTPWHGRPVYGVLHLGDLAPNRNPRMTLPTKLDWRRIPAIVRGAWPLPLPERLIVGPDSIGEMVEWFKEAHANAPYLAWDTEFIWDEDNPRSTDNYKLTMLSVAYPGMRRGIQLLYVGGEADSWMKAEFIRQFYGLSMAKPHVGHNFTAELRSTQKTWGWKPEKFWGRFDDTMLAHSVLWSEFPHTLEFLESVYGQHRKIKHLPTTDPLRNWGDSVLTVLAWEALKKEFANDPDSERVYRTQPLPLVPIKYRRESVGIAVNKERVGPAFLSYRDKLVTAERLAQAYAGWPINLNSSQQLGLWLYDLENHAPQRSKNKKSKGGRSLDAVRFPRPRRLS